MGVAGHRGIYQDGEQRIVSDSTDLTEAGRYCWRGEFTPDTATLAAGARGATHGAAG